MAVAVGMLSEYLPNKRMVQHEAVCVAVAP